MMKPKVLVIFPKDRDKVELKSYENDYTILFHDFNIESFRSFIYKKKSGQALNAENMIEQLIDFAKKNQIDGIFSTDDYPGSLFASIIAKELNLPGPEPTSVISCQHKLLSRTIQQDVLPHETPQFCFMPYNKSLQHITIPAPFFIKPIKACLSTGAQQIDNKNQLQGYIEKNLIPASFSEPLAWALKKYTTHTVETHGCIIEELLPGEGQITLEGYAYDGEITLRGIVDSHMYPNTMSFSHFLYPSQVPPFIQEKIAHMTKKVMRQIKYNNGLFNIEFMYDVKTKSANIIEINTRMASQFADLYEKVDGTNTYQIALDLALGNKPKIKVKSGVYKTAASFVLRSFHDAQVISVPKNQDIQKVQNLFKQSRIAIIAKPNTYLSDYLQDAHSFRYCLIHLGAQSIKELMHFYKQCKKMLPFNFKIPRKEKSL